MKLCLTIVSFVFAVFAMPAASIVGEPSPGKKDSLPRFIQIKEVELKEGWYKCRGVDLDDKPYTGVAVIRKLKDQYVVHWYIDSAAITGTGILVGDKFSVGWLRNNSRGVNVYDVLPKGRLDGQYAALPTSDGKLRRETLTWWADLDKVDEEPDSNE